MSDENQPKSEEKISFRKKVSSGFSSGINAIDNKTNPVVGKYLYVIFRWTTIALFFLILPLFVLFFQFAATEDGYTFSYNSITLNSQGILTNEEISKTYDYEEIDSSINTIYNEPSLFASTIFAYQEADSGLYFFYGVFVGEFGATAETTPSDYVTASQTWYTTVSADPETSFNTWIASKTIDEAGSEDDASTYAGRPDLAQEKFRSIFKPISITNDDDSVLNAGLITGWVLIGVAIITSILAFWFSKYSEVPLSNKKDKEGGKE